MSFLPAFLGKFFQVNFVNLAVGTIGFDAGIEVDLHGQLSSELMTPLQERAFRRKGADRDEILNEAARLAPQDASLFVYLRGDIGDVLDQVLASLDPAAVELLEEAMQSTGRYRDLSQLVDELDLAFADRLVLVVRPNDYPEDPEGPPHNDVPVPAIAIITWVQKDKEPVIEDLRDLIGRQGSKFGLEGGQPGQSGYYKNYVGGYEIREYWSPFVDGTGVIATVSAGDLCIVANSFFMLDHILKTQTLGAPSHPRLSERFEFRELLASSLPEANAVVWVDPQSLARTLRKQVRQWARDSIRIDWAEQRAMFEQQVIDELYPGQGKVRGPPDRGGAGQGRQPRRAEDRRGRRAHRDRAGPGGDGRLRAPHRLLRGGAGGALDAVPRHQAHGHVAAHRRPAGGLETREAREVGEAGGE